VLAEGLMRPDDVHVITSLEGTFAYFVERGTAGEAGGALKRVEATLSGNAVVQTLATGLENPRGIEIDGQLYFVARDGLYAVPMSGGTPRRVAGDVLTSSAPFAVDPSFAYLYRAGGISQVRLTDGSVVTPRYRESGLPIALAVDEGRVFLGGRRFRLELAEVIPANVRVRHGAS
jgi:hypothetical protein